MLRNVPVVPRTRPRGGLRRSLTSGPPRLRLGRRQRAHDRLPRLQCRARAARARQPPTRGFPLRPLRAPRRRRCRAPRAVRRCERRDRRAPGIRERQKPLSQSRRGHEFQRHRAYRSSRLATRSCRRPDRRPSSAGGRRESLVALHSSVLIGPRRRKGCVCCVAQPLMEGPHSIARAARERSWNARTTRRSGSRSVAIGTFERPTAGQVVDCPRRPSPGSEINWICGPCAFELRLAFAPAASGCRPSRGAAFDTDPDVTT
jgi:hypothetical protein